MVDLSHNKISNVFDLHMKIGNVAKLGLAHNQLASLEGTVHVYTCIILQYGLAYTMYNIHVHVHVYRYMYTQTRLV